jgi:hypothetical protein
MTAIATPDVDDISGMPPPPFFSASSSFLDFAYYNMY